MKIVEIKDAKNVGKEPVIIAENGHPVTALVNIKNVDMETVSLSTNQKFIDLIISSRERQKKDGGKTDKETRQILGLNT